MTINLDCYMRKILYINLMVTTNKKPVIDMQKNKEKGIQVYHEESQEIMWAKINRRKKQKNYKNNHKTSNKMTIST